MPVLSRNATDGQMASAVRLGARGHSCARELHIREKFGAARDGPRSGEEVGSSWRPEACWQQLQGSPAPKAQEAILRAVQQARQRCQAPSGE